MSTKCTGVSVHAHPLSAWSSAHHVGLRLYFADNTCLFVEYTASTRDFLGLVQATIAKVPGQVKRTAVGPDQVNPEWPSCSNWGSRDSPRNIRSKSEILNKIDSIVSGKKYSLLATYFDTLNCREFAVKVLEYLGVDTRGVATIPWSFS